LRRFRIPVRDETVDLHLENPEPHFAVLAAFSSLLASGENSRWVGEKGFNSKESVRAAISFMNGRLAVFDQGREKTTARRVS
jgi:hypothetical protein